jgi:hypothetical protein
MLYQHKPHPHRLQNVNVLHQAEVAVSNFNTRIAVAITRATGSMECAYIFAIIAFLGFPALSSWLGPVVALYILWLSSEFIQLVMLPILSVGQQVLSRKSELQADEAYHATLKSFHDIEQIMKHLDAQDLAILRILEKIEGVNYE